MTGVCEHAEGKLSCQEVIVYDFHCESNFLNVFIREQKILHAQELLLFGKYSVKKQLNCCFFPVQLILDVCLLNVVDNLP